MIRNCEMHSLRLERISRGGGGSWEDKGIANDQGTLNARISSPRGWCYHALQIFTSKEKKREEKNRGEEKRK